MSKVVILGGGTSLEREISLKSSSSIYEAAKTAAYEVLFIDPANGLDQLDNLPKDSLVLPILHGAEGEDGVIQKYLEELGLKYLGSNSQVSAICFDKWATKETLMRAGLPVANGALVDAKSYASNSLAHKPHVLKVDHGGSSIGTLLVHDPAHVDQQKVNGVFKLDYENKYNGKSQELCPPRSINHEQQIKAQRLAITVHKTMGCRHLSRTDMIVRPSGDIIVLEINTIPGMTSQSLLPKAAQVAGLDFVALVKKFVAMVGSS